MRKLRYIFIFITFFLNTSLYSANCSEYMRGIVSHERGASAERIGAYFLKPHSLGELFCEGNYEPYVTEVTNVHNDGTIDINRYYLLPLPTCLAPNVWDVSKNSCVNNVHCTLPKVLDKDTGTCVIPTPDCNSSTYLDTTLNECVSLTFSLPDSFPDNNSSFGSFYDLTAPYAESDCTGLITSYIGVASLKWDSSSSTCKAHVFECNKGYTFDSNNNVCIQPVSTIIDTSTCSGEYSINYMSHLDFCNDDCSLSVPAWSAPTGYENNNLQCGHSYSEYRCSADYRIKKFVELSCSSTSTTHDMVISPDSSSSPIDTTTNNLSDINSSQSSIDNTSAINSLGSKVDTTNKKLDDVNNNLNDLKNTLSGKNKGSYINPNGDNQSGLMTFLDGAKSGFDDITGNFKSLKNTVDNGFSVPSLSVGVEPKFQATVFNHNVEIDLCTSFSVFRPVMYYLFFISFNILALTMFYRGFRVLLS